MTAADVVFAPDAGEVPWTTEACRLATEDELPGVAARLVAKASAAGWRVAATYAASEAGRSTVVRLQSEHGHAVAVWTDTGSGWSSDFHVIRPAGWSWWERVPVAVVERVVAAPKRSKRWRPTDPTLPVELDDVEPPGGVE